MFDVFSSIKSLLKIDSVSIDNNVFRLHYKATMFVLVAFSLLVTQKQYFGDPIDCIVSGVDSDIMDMYCWIHTTFTLPDFWDKKIGDEVPHPGIATPNKSGPDDVHEKKYHKYYQWVTLFLYFQAVLFYIPRYLWKVWEAGRIKMLVMSLNSPFIDGDSKRDQKTMLVNYFMLNIHNHQAYLAKFIICETLNFINVIGQIYFTDLFLGYEFTTYGMEVLNFTQNDFGTRTDPMDKVFPKVTKCTFKKFGPSGTPETHDGLCILPLNIFNEKIYIFLWFWFIIIAVISGLGLLYRICTFVKPFRQVLLRSRARLSSSATIEQVSRKCDVGDWFVLYQLAKNMDPIVYREFLEELSDKLTGKDAM